MRKMNCSVGAATLAVGYFLSTSHAQVILPGTQPKEAGRKFAKVKNCQNCHGKTKNGPADPFFSWQGGMMAQAARDPVFYAALAIANQDIEGVGEFCIRCHSPRGWLDGRSTTADGSALNSEDLNGVTCEVCHRMVDPKFSEGRKLVDPDPPGYGNAMFVIDPTNTARGPYGDGKGAMPHKVLQSEFHASGKLCGVCHNVSNPTLARDAAKQPPYAYGHIERTYSEWFLSDFAREKQSCQSCHYPPVEGGGLPSRYGKQHRDHFVMHGPTGGSTWVQDATYFVWGGDGMSREALDAGIERARALLKTAASLDLSFPKPDHVRVRVTNLTGHKLPTGYPEGRRMWAHIQFMDAEGAVIAERGRYGEIKDTIFGEDVMVPTLIEPELTRVYECLPGISAEQAKKTGKPAGKSFHFVLNDMIVKDNRIPPKGFRNRAFAGHLAAPIGATYKDGQHWDEFDVNLPPGTAKVAVRLQYQSVSWEYLKFLAEENRTDNWGKRLYQAWQQTGRCPPETIVEAEAAVGSP